jgi:hypothetical protein
VSEHETVVREGGRCEGGDALHCVALCRLHCVALCRLAPPCEAARVRRVARPGAPSAPEPTEPSTREG